MLVPLSQFRLSSFEIFAEAGEVAFDVSLDNYIICNKQVSEDLRTHECSMLCISSNIFKRTVS